MLNRYKKIAVVAAALLLNPLLLFAEDLIVYKSETCGCCIKWIEHLEKYGITSAVEHPADLNALKKQMGITAQTASCHTAVTEEGYVFEGHVPAPVMQAFLDDAPEGALGLSVPGMPAGSPGMEMGDTFQPYKVFQMNKDGTTEVYASIDKAVDQY